LIGSPPATALHLLRAYFFLNPQALMSDVEALAVLFVGNDGELIKALTLLHQVDGPGAFVKVYLYLLRTGVIEALFCTDEEQILKIAILTTQVSIETGEDDESNRLIMAQHHLNLAIKYKHNEFSDSIGKLLQHRPRPLHKHSGHNGLQEKNSH